MSEFLEPEELRRLTACTPAAKQDQWLTEQGIPHRLVDGCRMIVSRYHVWQWEYAGLGAALKPDWLAMALGPDATRYAPTERCPADGGVYLLWANDEPIYVGQSLSLSYRITQHSWAAQRGARRPFDAYSAVEVPPELMVHVEVAHIHALAPRDNRRIDIPSWRHHEAFVQHIRSHWGAANQ